MRHSQADHIAYSARNFATAAKDSTLFQNVRAFDGKGGTLYGPTNVRVTGPPIARISNTPIAVDLNARTTVIAGGHGDFRQTYEIPRVIGGPLSRGEQIGGSAIADGPDEVLVRAREQLMLGASQVKLTAGGGVASPHSPPDKSTFTEPSQWAVAMRWLSPVRRRPPSGASAYVRRIPRGWHSR